MNSCNNCLSTYGWFCFMGLCCTNKQLYNTYLTIVSAWQIFVNVPVAIMFSIRKLLWNLQGNKYILKNRDYCSPIFTSMSHLCHLCKETLKAFVEHTHAWRHILLQTYRGMPCTMSVFTLLHHTAGSVGVGVCMCVCVSVYSWMMQVGCEGHSAPRQSLHG